MSAIIDDKIVAGAQSSSEVKEDPIVALSERVESLYNFRDHYFENHSVENAINKNNDIEREMREALGKFDECKGYEIDGCRAKYYYLKGKTFNVVDRFIPQAEELLSKAVKLEPTLIDAWNELGESYWKNDDMKQAKNCFAGALTHERNKTSLRNLSMVLRQESTDNPTQRLENIKLGVEHAKEAVKMDPSDGTSWTILGNAYLASFFTISQNPATLRLCMTAYAQAEKDVVAKNKPNLCFNKATALKYQEEYKLALEAFNRAVLLDPTWEAPKTKLAGLLKYLNDVQNSICTNGRLKSKRLHQMIQGLDKKHMGPYKEGSYKFGNRSIKLELTPIKNLITGVNIGKVIFGKVVCWIHDSDAVPFSFCMVDEEKTCATVTVYNLAEGRGVTVGDSVAIAEPFLINHQFTFSGNEFDFKSIRVETPVLLVVNGRKLDAHQQAGATISSYKRPD